MNPGSVILLVFIGYLLGAALTAFVRRAFVGEGEGDAVFHGAIWPLYVLFVVPAELGSLVRHRRREQALKAEEQWREQARIEARTRIEMEAAQREVDKLLSH